IPALGDCLLRLGNGPIENLNCLCRAPGKQAASRLQSKQQAVERLQQGIVEVPCDACALADALFQTHIELLGEVIQTVAVNGPHRKKNQSHTSAPEPPGLPE